MKGTWRRGWKRLGLGGRRGERVAGEKKTDWGEGCWRNEREPERKDGRDTRGRRGGDPVNLG